MKKFLKENRVLLVLFLITIICIGIIGYVTITYFYGSNDNVYGDRLDGLKEISKENIDKIKEELNNEKTVKDSNIVIKGRIIYITINYVDNTLMDDGKKYASKIFELFSDEDLNNYDIEFTIRSNKGDVVVEENKNSKKKKEKQPEFESYVLMGARNATGSEQIVWNNYNMSYKEVEESKE